LRISAGEELESRLENREFANLCSDFASYPFPLIVDFKRSTATWPTAGAIRGRLNGSRLGIDLPKDTSWP
jgi:hypothetical protein